MNRRGSPTSRWIRVLPAVLLTIFVLQAVLSLRQKSVTADEIIYITAGYYHLCTGRFDFNMTNPPLLKMISAAPLLFLDPELPEMGSAPAKWSESEQGEYARKFLYSNRVDADAILFAARLPIVVLGVILGTYVFRWSRRLYGDAAGVLALLLFAFSPNILAHSRLATMDLGVTTLMFITAYAFWGYIHRPSLRTWLPFAASFSAAALGKTTAFFMLPVFVLVSLVLIVGGSRLGVWERLPWVTRFSAEQVRQRQMLSFALVFVMLATMLITAINVAYLFEDSFQPLSSFFDPARVYRFLALDSEISRSFADFGLAIPLPFPKPFLRVVGFQFTRVLEGNNVYFAGETSRDGWWYLMIAAFLIKSPIPLLLLLTWVITQLFRGQQISSAEWILITTCGVLMVLFSALKSVNIGLRYVLPIYPCLHVLASRLLKDGFPRLLWRNLVLVGLSLWYVVGTASIFPDHLAFFNEFVGGPKNGYRYLADSNLDWGQDMKQLKGYLDEKGIEKIRLAYFGAGDADYYGIDYEYLPSVGLTSERPAQLPPLELSGERIAISATLLAGVFYPGYYAPLRDLEPVDQIGHSILIFEPE